MTTPTTERRAPAVYATVALIEPTVRTRARVLAAVDLHDPHSALDLAVIRPTGAEYKTAVRYGHTAGCWTDWDG